MHGHLGLAYRVSIGAAGLAATRPHYMGFMLVSQLVAISCVLRSLRGTFISRLSCIEHTINLGRVCALFWPCHLV